MSQTPLPPPPPARRSRLRWALPPVMAATLVAGFGVAPSLIGSSAGAAPILPVVTAEDLVTNVLSSTPPAFSGVVSTSTNLGLPALGSLAPAGSSLLSTLLSPHSVQVSSAPGGKVHLAIPDVMAETDLVSDGSQLWLWQSGPQTVTHLAKPADSGAPDGPGADAEAAHTPGGLARSFLSNIDPTTRVFLGTPTTVAGQKAYELVLAPRSADTLVADVVIDVDATTFMPLQVKVMAKDATTSALTVGFETLVLKTPADSVFTFSPPPGATVKEAASPDQLLFGSDTGGDHQGHHARGDAKNGAPAPTAPADATAPAAHTQVLGSGWDAVVAIPNAPKMLTALARPQAGGGRLITSTLVDALVLDDGTALVGMVGPARLQAAVAELHP